MIRVRGTQPVSKSRKASGSTVSLDICFLGGTLCINCPLQICVVSCHICPNILLFTATNHSQWHSFFFFSGGVPSGKSFPADHAFSDVPCVVIYPDTLRLQFRTCLNSSA